MFFNLATELCKVSDFSSLLKQFKKTPITKEFIEWLKSRDAELLKYIFTFLCFAKKFEYIDESFQATAFRGWLSVEERLRNTVLPEWLSDVRKLALTLDKLDKSKFKPHFGPKHVAEKGVLHPWTKYDMLYLDKGDRSLLHSLVGNGKYHMIIRGLSTTVAEKPVARGSFVAKDLTKDRSMAMEPNKTMLFQQGFRHVFEDLISNSWLSRFIHLHDQSFNQFGAWLGSCDQSLATIDLSAASDSLSIKLLRRIFPNHLRHPLEVTRTPVINFLGEEFNVEKYAPMGSALCFPIQCITYALIVLYAYMLYFARLYGGDHQGRLLSAYLANPKRFLSEYILGDFDFLQEDEERLQPFLCYGDDLVVDSRVYDIVVELLMACGFECNLSKSYTGSQAYRESCGEHYWNGDCITPYYLRIHDFSFTSCNSNMFASMIAMINAAFIHKRKHLRKYLISILRSSLPSWSDQLLYVSLEDSPRYPSGIITTNPNNMHLVYRYNHIPSRDEYDDTRFPPTEVKDWHTGLNRGEIRYLGTRSRVEPVNLRHSEFERYSYIREVDRQREGHVSDFTDVDHSPGISEQYLGWVWAPLGGRMAYVPME